MKLLAVIGGMTLVAATAGGLYLATVVRRGLSARQEPSWAETRVAGGLRRLSVPERVKALANPQPATPQVLAAAREHWADHCASCHANDGSGDTTLGQRMFPKAPDMRQAATQELSDGELYFIIQNGVRLTGMPAWGEPVEDDLQTWGLVAFIRHLPSLTPAELEEMKKLNPISPHELQERKEEEQFLNPQDHQGEMR